ncbi:dermonecrotic toxin domain-containing protein [Pseudomonas sp. SDO528_S397]
MSVSLNTPHTHALAPTRGPIAEVPVQASDEVPPPARANGSPAEMALVEAYLAAVQRKIVHNKAGLIKVPPQSLLGQWLDLYRAQLEHPLVKHWLREQNIEPHTLTVNPATGAMVASVEGTMKSFSLTDSSGWGQISRPLLSIAKVLVPVPGDRLRVQLGPDFVEVRAKQVASFHGEPLPTNPTQARAQIRRLEHSKAFDPLSPDDRLRPAAHRSAQALETHKQNAARFYRTLPQVLAYKQLTTEVAQTLPNTRVEAKKWAEALILKLTGQHVDADTLYLNRFANAQSGNTMTGWTHNFEEPVSSLRLPDALLKNFSEHDWVPGNLDLEAGLYTDGPGQSDKGGYGQRNEFPLAPSQLMHTSWKTDFQAQMDQKIQRFWSTHGDDYRAVLKGEFIAQARKQLKEQQARSPAERALQPPEQRFTRRDYELLMNAVPDVPKDEHAPLSVAQLRAQVPAKGLVQAHEFDINGWGASDIVRFTAVEPGQKVSFNQRRDGTQILYVPGATPAFLRFDSLKQLDQWVVNQAQDPKKREALASHFSLYNRQDGGVFGRFGVDSALEHLASGGWTPREGVTIDRANTPIHDDVFTHIKKQSSARMSSDADSVITSNSEVTRDTWLNDISVAAGLLSRLAPIAVPVVAVAVAVGVAEISLGAEKSVSGDTQAERSAGAWKAFDGTLNTLFSALGAAGESEDPFELPTEEPPVPAPAEAPAPEPPAANRLQPSQAGNISALAVPEGESLIADAPRNTRGIYQTTDSSGVDHWFIRYTDSTGVPNIYEIRSDFKLSDNYVQIIDRAGKAVMTVRTSASGEWERDIGAGGMWRWWRRSPPSPTASNDFKTPPTFADAFPELEGTRIKGAEKFDDYLQMGDDIQYESSSTSFVENRSVKKRLGVSWTLEENTVIEDSERAVPTPLGNGDYSPSFVKDIHRFPYTLIVKENGVETRSLLKSTATTEEGLKQERLQQLEALIPDPALRARISEVAHQGSLASATTYMNLPDSGLKAGYLMANGEAEITIEYDATARQAQVKFVSRNPIANPELDITKVPDALITIKRTFTIKEGNEVIDSERVYVIDPHAPTHMELSIITPT